VDYTKLAQDFMEVMNQLRKRKTQKHLNDSMQGEHFILFYVSHHQGDSIPSEISNEMGISTARIAAALNNLESKGMITRTIDVTDRRRILIKLTDAGQKHVEQHHKMIMEITTNMLKYLGEDDAKDLIRIMKKLAEKSPEDFM
jgi:MarR family transcriptional regulator, organic hydroperoxide resistance regulator